MFSSVSASSVFGRQTYGPSPSNSRSPSTALTALKAPVNTSKQTSSQASDSSLNIYSAHSFSMASPAAFEKRQQLFPAVAESAQSADIPRNADHLRANNASVGESSAQNAALATGKNKLEQQKQQHDQAMTSQLAARDREVRAHEQAHMAVGGAYAGAAKYQFQRGPDGVNYAVGGEVPIDVSKEASPEQSIRKAQIVRRAALAPAEPSPQDRLVAAEASRMEIQARQELARELRQEEPSAEVSEPENIAVEITQNDSSEAVGNAPKAANYQSSVDNSQQDNKPSAIHSRLQSGIENTQNRLSVGARLDEFV